MNDTILYCLIFIVITVAFMYIEEYVIRKRTDANCEFWVLSFTHKYDSMEWITEKCISIKQDENFDERLSYELESQWDSPVASERDYLQIGFENGIEVSLTFKKISHTDGEILNKYI